MFDSIINFFESINPSFGTFVISMIPVIELRGAIPAGIHVGLHWLWVYVLCVVGNMLPIPFVIWIIRPLIEWLVH